MWLEDLAAGQAVHCKARCGLVMKDHKGLPEMGLYSGRSGEPLEIREQESDMPPHGQWGD